MLAGFWQLLGLYVELAQILVRSLVVGIVVERLLVERQRPCVVAGLAQAEAQEIVNVGVLDPLVEHAVEVGERALELLGLDLGAHGGQVSLRDGRDLADSLSLSLGLLLTYGVGILGFDQRPSNIALIIEMRRKGAALGVRIEAEYTVGEYDILILSATQSDGLVTWFNGGGYKMPAGASPVLAPTSSRA
jgi:Uncharacterized protein conserved in bacteria (DUF2330)